MESDRKKSYKLQSKKKIVRGFMIRKIDICDNSLTS